MNGAHLHLITNHIPVVGIVLVVALLLYALWRKTDELQLLSLGAMVLVGVLSFPAYFSGEPAEDHVEDIPGISKDDIHEHEAAAKYAIFTVEFTALLALAALALRYKSGRVPSWAIPATLLCAAFTSSVMIRTAFLGGRIHHPEIDDNVQLKNDVNTNSDHIDEDENDEREQPVNHQ